MTKDSAIKVTTSAMHYTTATLLFLSFNVAANNLYPNISHVEPNTLNNVTGIVGVNMAAGDSNIQSNTRSIAIGKGAQAISKSTLSTQQLNNNSNASVSLGKNTLHNAHGIIAINQASGSGNTQLNDITIAFGDNAQAISDISLSANSIPNSSQVNQKNNSNGIKKVELDKNSLNGATGAIQVNQIAGSGNIAVNRVSMPIQ
ncbi:hypothetical protein [Oceanisphaera pacifica]|uniref:Adhesin n=1 Tax=Oceanisphaera pacifica TaxID=2818389 RepID=A0ABS3NFB9_9GAMM|nr:hypothetical protein [Oceanisphaera pacifica]MBO1519222.1 hypothetical protein [Oceanisphaera pacifica]